MALTAAVSVLPRLFTALTLKLYVSLFVRPVKV
jgi:hypothetical protein